MTGEEPSYREKGLWGGDGGGIFGGAQDDTDWASGRGETELKALTPMEEPRTYCMALLAKGCL